MTMSPNQSDLNFDRKMEIPKTSFWGNLIWPAIFEICGNDTWIANYNNLILEVGILTQHFWICNKSKWTWFDSASPKYRETILCLLKDSQEQIAWRLWFHFDWLTLSYNLGKTDFSAKLRVGLNCCLIWFDICEKDILYYDQFVFFAVWDILFRCFCTLTSNNFFFQISDL